MATEHQPSSTGGRFLGLLEEIGSETVEEILHAIVRMWLAHRKSSYHIGDHRHRHQTGVAALVAFPGCRELP
jgi:hypothetical protein